MTSPLNKLSYPAVMGAVNVTPDSFYRHSRVQSVDDALRMAEAMVNGGAQIIDIGGEATNPMLDVTISTVSIEEEIDRVAPVVEAVAKQFDTLISVDTSKPEVMAAAVSAGAGMINDQRALTRPGAVEQAAALKVPVCLMQMYGLHVHDMNGQPYADTLLEIKQYLLERVECCLEAGIASEHLIIDPGFGTGNYGKSTEENLYLLKHLDQLAETGYPVLVGFSRKTMIGDVLGVGPEHRLYGSLSLAMIAAQKGAAIIRVHDVAETVQVLKMQHAVEMV